MSTTRLVLRDDECMKWLTDDERAMATAYNAYLWRALAHLRAAAVRVVDGAERLDHHGFNRAIETDRLRLLHGEVAGWTKKDSGTL